MYGKPLFLNYTRRIAGKNASTLYYYYLKNIFIIAFIAEDLKVKITS